MVATNIAPARSVSLMLQLTAEHLAAIDAWAMPIDWIAEVWLFGSRARGTARSDSDFDIAVVLRPGTSAMTSADTLWHFEGEVWERAISAALGAHVSFYLLDHLPKAPRGDAVRIWVRPTPSRS